MKILAIEFSSAQRSVAVLDSRTGVPPVLLGRAVQTGPQTQAFALIESVLTHARLGREQVEGLAIGLGPGSYAGIRVAISIAQGWQLARNVAVQGVSSVECLAYQAQQAGITGRVRLLVDAQRQEFYLATYEVSSGVVRPVDPLALVTLAEAKVRCQAGDTLIGPDVQAWFPEARVQHPHAATLGRLAAARSGSVPAERLEPIYLRATQFVKVPPPRGVPNL